MLRDRAPHTTAPGKISSGLFERSILPHLGRSRSDVLVPPHAGIDCGILDLGNGQVMSVTTDPFYVDPAFGWRRAAWFAVHIVASDAATSGLQPSHLAIDLNLPTSMSDSELQELWIGVSDACDDLGVAVVAGHTARYDGCTYPMLGGATMLALGAHGDYVVPTMAHPGDAVILTKGAAIETTGIFGVLCARQIEDACGPDTARAAARLFDSMTVVRDARIAVTIGVRERGVTAMHDATERGIWGALVEVAQAAGTGIVVEQEAIPIRPETDAVCRLFEIDPYSTSSEGTLIVTCVPHVASELIARLSAEGIPAAQIGRLTPANEGLRVVSDGRESKLRAPVVDPFWPALLRAMGAVSGD